MKFSEYLKEEETVKEDIATLIVTLVPTILGAIIATAGYSGGRTLNPITFIKNYWKARKVVKQMKSLPKEELEKITAELSQKISNVDADVPSAKAGYDPNWQKNLEKIILRNNLQNDLRKIQLDLNSDPEKIDKQDFLDSVKRIKDSIKLDDKTIEKLALAHAEE